MKFGTDGVRGRAHEELTPAFATRLARAVARGFGTTTVVIGRDTRESGPAFAAALAAGFAAEKVTVLDLGVAPTPAVAYICASLDIAGVVISASHNAWHDNGLKVFAPGGEKLTDKQQATVEALLEQHVAERTDHAPSTTVAYEPGLDGYMNHLFGAMEGRSLAGQHIVLDCANGAVSPFAPALFESLGATVSAIHADPDGRNINEACGSTDLTDLQAKVIAEGADLGLAFDGDADRVLAVSNTGEVVDGDTIIALLAIDLAAAGTLVENTVVVTVMTNLGFHRAMQAKGIKVDITRVGDRYVLESLGANGWVLGGEQSGHVIYRRFATTGDGMLAGALLADLVQRDDRSLDEMRQILRPVPQYLVNVPVTGDAQMALDAMQGEIASCGAQLADSGRVLVRASGTEPLLRVMVEADDAARAATITDRLVRAAQIAVS
jgi:phosphoglucosamine mutase